MQCRHCQSKSECFLDMGFSPPSNGYLTEEKLNYPEQHFPLRVHVCEHCWLVQTCDVIDPKDLFTDEYAYFSSTSASWLKHAQLYSKMIIDKLSLNSASYVIEIGSNDGYLLQYFQTNNIPSLGIEPSTSTAMAAQQKGIKTIEKFFNSQLAQSLPKADLVIGNNVYAHTPNINDFTKALKLILKPSGVVTLEFPHLLNLINQTQFDTIYHEHFSYLSLYTVTQIFNRYGLDIFDVEKISTHGGSLRIYGCHKDASYDKSPIVQQIIEEEENAGLKKLQTYKDFTQRVYKIRDQFLKFLMDSKKAGKRVVAFGAAAKGNTLINFAGVKNNLIEVVYDSCASKQGKYLPGSHIPIQSIEKLNKALFDFILILPWNIQSEIEALLRDKYEVSNKKMVSFDHKTLSFKTLDQKPGDNFIPVFKPLLQEEEINAATRTLEIGWLGMGASVNEFEAMLKSIIGQEDRYVVAVSTGHAALHLAMLLIDLKPGDEVITPSFNNIADFQAILAVGAKPVFCDVLEDTLCIDVKKAEQLITPKTKAIIATDYGVFIAEHEALSQLAIKHNLRIIHDAAHSIGSFYKDRPIGSFSDITMFSFDPVKTITCIDGGALIVKTEEEAKLLQKMRLIGMEQSPDVLYKNQRAWFYDVNHLGFRYHMANLHAAIGCAQLAKLDVISQSRKDSCRLYNELLSQIPEIIHPQTDYENIAPFLYFIRVNAAIRTSLKTFLKSKNIDTGIHWQPGHLFSLFKDYKQGDLSVTNQIGKEILTLPLHSEMEEKFVIYICNQIASFFEKDVPLIRSQDSLNTEKELMV